VALRICSIYYSNVNIDAQSFSSSFEGGPCSCEKIWKAVLFYYVLGGGTHALHGSTSPPPPPPPSASPHLNLRGLVFNFKFKVSVALSFFCCGFFFWDKVFYRYRRLLLFHDPIFWRLVLWGGTWDQANTNQTTN
jgi:hypothetical protein